MRDEYIRQHYVPRHHLEQFTIPSSNTNVWCYDKAEQRTFQVSISRIAVENYFYDGRGEDARTELWLQNLEGEISGENGPYQKILHSEENNLSNLSSRERGFLAIYVAVQELRTRRWRNSIDDTVSQLQDLIGEEATEQLRTEMTEFREERSLREFQSEFLREYAGRMAQMLLDRLHWLVLENNTDMPLWTSDDPVVRFNTRRHGELFSMGVLSRGIEIYFPLSPNHILYLIDPEEYRTELAVMPRTINDIEQIIFFNDLQVQLSERHIFSYDDDFSLAERRLAETPEVGNPDRPRGEVQLGFPDEDDYS